MLPERADELVGTTLGKDYRVLEPIGVGATSVVYLVEHQTLRTRFAAKVLSRELTSSAEARARFTQAAHAAALLDHEHVAVISEVGVAVGQRPYAVRELLLGPSLDQRLAERPMTIEEVVAVGFPVARALSHAHAQGIVHGDLKPENIFLVQGSHGRWGVKLVDFGLTRSLLAGSVPGELVAGPVFMAPEALRGDPADPRADIYSFGILLHLMICGRLPFVDGQLRVLQMQLIELPARPRAINHELSPELAMIVERAAARRPDDRYPSIDALLRDLTAALPMGADRLLIEAQAGASYEVPPGAPRESQRMARASQPPPLAVSTSALAVPSGVPNAALSGSLPGMQPLGPNAPQRRRAPIVISTALATTVAGALLVHQLTTGPAAPPPASPTMAAAVPRTDVASPTPTPISAPAVAAAPTGAGDPAPVDVTTDAPAEPHVAAPSSGRSPAVANEPIGRVKPVIRRELSRPAKPAPVIASAAGSTGRLAAPAEAPPSGSQRMEVAEAPPEPDGGRPASPAAGGARDAGTPPAPMTPDAPPAPMTPGAPITPTAPVGPGSLDATPSVASLDVKGSLSPSIVRRSVERTLGALRACYRTAARAGGATPAVELRLTFEIDENSLATQVATSGASFGSLATCAAGVAGQIRTQEAPDVGTVQVAVVIRFRPS